ncbi:unnamed protein product, partial [Heterosigma akashiwo]
RGGAGAGRGGAGTGLDEKSRTKLSKKLSYALRHGAVELGLEISRDGYVAVNQLLQLKMFKPATFDQVKAAVREQPSAVLMWCGICSKSYNLWCCLSCSKSFDGVWKIRANQGHSVGQVVKDEDLLQRITSEAGFSTVVHGTYYRCWDAIRTEGLKVMTRNHIHFASGLPSDNGVMSGMRRSAEIWIFLDLKRALEDGIEFFLSSNGVILTPGDQRGVLSPLYFSRVVDSRTQREIQAGLNTSNTTENRGAARRNHHDDDHYSKQRKKKVKKKKKKNPWPDKAANTIPEPLSLKIKIKPQEIIEFPTVLVDARTLKVVSEFQTYVRPVHHPNLSGFCISLTGIQQEWVDQAPIFIEAFELHRQWMEVQGLLPYQGKNTILFVTCGDWDLMQMLPSQCRLTNTKIPSYLQEWVNIKDIFCQRWNLDKSMGMVGMLRKSGLRLEGRHHSGIDDCRNIARLLIQLCK